MHYWVNATALFGPQYFTDYVLYRFAGYYFDHCKWYSVTDHFAGPSNEELQKWPLYDVGGTLVGFYWRLLLFDGSGVNNYRLNVDWAPAEQIPVDHEAFGSCDKLEYKLPHEVLGPIFDAVILAGYPDACDDDDYPAKVQRKPFTWQP